MPQVYIIQINVEDMDKAIDWYCNTLGFKLSKKNYHYPVAVDLLHKGVRLVLHKANFIKNNYPPNGRTQICIQVNNIISTLKRLNKNGCEIIHNKPLNFPMGKYAAFKDPFGNIHELVELKRERKIR